VHKGGFPEPESITDNEQLGVGAFAFQFLQKPKELTRVIAVL
jgi:hypothetical protein